ncbi:cell division protein ZapD [Verticiella sediminum]|uniref:Cell division protein ZapD n=1 Tax=Verticiella sediminum TaxID=1247510 RepID=A0A556A7L2_9BURK|nr:cell division protein ZapD [Verticiella sediminum]TSH88849.1 cell division protein ZapD [Verticiella sediminum]
MILYEYPFNERIRNFLRLEDQFDRLLFFVQQDDVRAQHAALGILFEISDAIMRGAGRADVRTELLHELERQRHSLAALREHPGVDRSLLDATVERIQEAGNELTNHTKPAEALRQNEWLASLRSRLVIPGGVCEFDMPSYYAWQQRPAEDRRADLQRWCAPLWPLQDALDLTLRLTRQTGEVVDAVAPQGLYQQVPSGKAYQLLQVRLSDDAVCFPEISANKYSISIRFSTQDGQDKPQPVAYDVPFKLTLCTSL